MTPVEERIDLDALRSDLERYEQNSERLVPISVITLRALLTRDEQWQRKWQNTVDLHVRELSEARDERDALLTEHSAREEVLSRIAFLLDPATGSPRPTEALRVARRALPATEPAQPERPLLDVDVDCNVFPAEEADA